MRNNASNALSLVIAGLCFLNAVNSAERLVDCIPELFDEAVLHFGKSEVSRTKTIPQVVRVEVFFEIKRSTILVNVVQRA